MKTSKSKRQTSKNDDNDNGANAALKRATKQICDLWRNASVSDARLRQKIGVRVHEAMNDEAKYGKGSVRYIAKELGCTAANLYDYAGVAAAWTNAEFEQLIKRGEASKTPLTISHFILIAKVEDAACRSALIDECITKGYTVRALTVRIAEVAPKAKKDAEVRALRPVDALEKLNASFTVWVAKAEADVGVLAKVESASTKEVVDQLELARDGYAKARGLLDQLEARIAELLVKAPKAAGEAT